MEINFSDPELIYIYGHFRKEAKKLEEIKNAPNCPVSVADIDKDIQLFSSIADKLKDACPGLSKLDNYKI